MRRNLLSHWPFVPTTLSSLLRRAHASARPSGRRRRSRTARRRPCRFENLEDRRVLATFLVTSAGDTVDPSDGETTLREALLDANALSGHDTIEFNVGSGGSQTITLTSALPAIRDPVTIDGASQPGAAGIPQPITLDASSITSFDVMRVSSGGGGSTLNNFAVRTSSSVPLLLLGADGNTIHEVDFSDPGTSPSTTGIRVDQSDHNIIRNSIINNHTRAVRLANSSHNLIENNQLGQGGEGVRFEGNSGQNTIRGNDASHTNSAIRDFRGTGSGNRFLDNDLSHSAWASIVIDSNSNPIELAGNDFEDSLALLLQNVSHLVLQPGPAFDLDVANARGGIRVENGHAVTIDGFDLSGHEGMGLAALGTELVITNLTLTGRPTGMSAWVSDSLIANVDAGAPAVPSSMHGISVVGDRNEVRGVTSRDRRYGIRLTGDQNQLHYNQLDHAIRHGIFVAGNENLVHDNSVRYAPRSGVVLAGSSGNTVERNDASSSGKGIEAIGGNQNRFIHNDLSGAAGFGLRLDGESQFVVRGNDFSESGGGVLLANMDQIDVRPGPDFDVAVATAGKAVVRGGLHLSNVTNSVISGFDLSAASEGASFGAGLGLTGGGNNQFRDITVKGRAAGVWMVGNSNDHISCSTVMGNSIGIRAQSNVHGFEVSESEFADNVHGIGNYTSSLILAEDNYWGASDGPAPLGGSGDGYFGSVDADPFLAGRPGCLPLELRNLAATPDEIDEGDSLLLSGQIATTTDASSWKLTVDWNDPASSNPRDVFQLGNAPMTIEHDGVQWDPATGEFAVPHQYVDDDPTVTSSDRYQIEVTVEASSGWTSRASLPTARQAPGAAEIGGEIYVVAGSPIGEGRVLEIYNIDSDQWRTGPDAPTNRSQPAVEAIGSRVYVTGGCVNSDCNHPTTALEAFDTDTQAWITGLAPMPTPRFGTASAVIGGKLYVVGGGLRGFTTTSNRLEIYDPAADQWTVGPDMPTARELPAATVIDGKLYVAGGLERNGSRVFDTTNVLEVYDPATNSWSTAAPMPTARHALTGETRDGDFYAMGGIDISSQHTGPFLDLVEIYDPSTDSWATGPSMPTARTLLTSVAVGDSIYTVGGVETGGGFSDAVERLGAGAESDTATLEVTVHNAAPRVADFRSDATFAQKASEGDSITVTGSFSDAGMNDTHSVEIHWGDGTSTTLQPTASMGSGNFAATHNYTTGGVYTVIVTLQDDDGGTAVAETTVVVTGVGMVGDELHIVGTAQDDAVTLIQQGNGQLRVVADFLPPGKPRSFDASVVDRVVVYLCEGNDLFKAAGQVAMPLVVHGDAGNDRLEAGAGPAILLGGAGNDRLGGGKGRDILIGGDGLDLLEGNQEDDVLIGGWTDLDGDLDLLAAALSAWRSEDSFIERAAAIDELFEVSDDEDEDELDGGSGQNLLYEPA